MASDNITLPTGTATVEKQENKAAASGYASLDAGTKVPLAQISEVLALADLSDVASKTGTSTQVVMATAPTLVGVTNTSFDIVSVNTQSGAVGYTIAATDEVVLFTSTAATQTITLPAASGGKRRLTVKNIGATNTFTVTRAGTDTINTLTALGATVTGAVAINGGVITIVSDGVSVWNQVT